MLHKDIGHGYSGAHTATAALWTTILGTVAETSGGGRMWTPRNLQTKSIVTSCCRKSGVSWG